MNRESGYWVISLDERAARKSLSGTILLPRPGFKAMIVSDGFARLFEDYGRFSSGLDLLLAVEEHGAAALLRQLRTIERKDFLGKVYPRVSFSDDASCIYITHQINS